MAQRKPNLVSMYVCYRTVLYKQTARVAFKLLTGSTDSAAFDTHTAWRK